jgi:hypothetical protein
VSLPRCPLDGKVPFPSKNAARKWLVKQPLLENKPPADRIYLCPHCRYWHVTGSHRWTSRAILERRNYGRRAVKPKRKRQRSS